MQHVARSTFELFAEFRIGDRDHGGNTLRERAAAMIAIADPKFREQLERAARDMLHLS